MSLADRVAARLEAPLRVADPLAPADAIVVLGAPLRRGRLSTVGAERVAGALALWRHGVAPRVCCTGAGEAEAMAEALRAGGVPAEALLIEPRARTTAENAREVAALLAPLDARTVWLVTQPFHARRARWLFARAGLSPRVWHLGASVQYRDRRRACRWLVREYAAWARLGLRAVVPGVR